MIPEEKAEYKVVFMGLTGGQLVIVGVLYIIYAVGLVGITASPFASSLIKLTPVTLTISLGLLIYAAPPQYRNSYFKAIAVIYALGLILEGIGVNFGMPFGVYHYLNNLGPMVLDTPISIGINWAILVVASSNFISGYIKNPLLAAIAAGMTMTALDFIIEPVAVKIGFWYWQNNIIPMQNYLTWFIASVAFSYYFSRICGTAKNYLAIHVLLVMIVFFSVLRLV